MLQFRPHDKCGIEQGGNRLLFTENFKISAYSNQIPYYTQNRKLIQQQPGTENGDEFCTSSLTLTLRGIGVKPEVKIEPVNQLLSVGPVLLGD